MTIYAETEPPPTVLLDIPDPHTTTIYTESMPAKTAVMMVPDPQPADAAPAADAAPEPAFQDLLPQVDQLRRGPRHAAPKTDRTVPEILMLLISFLTGLSVSLMFLLVMLSVAS